MKQGRHYCLLGFSEERSTDDRCSIKQKAERRLAELANKSASKREQSQTCLNYAEQQQNRQSQKQKQSTFDYAECEQIQDDKVGLKEKAEIRKETCEA